MSVSHRTNRLKVIGNPSVEKLQNGRFRLTFNMRPLNARNDWYNDNKSRIFADYGTLESAEMNVDGIEPRIGEAYTNMRLVSAEAGNRSQVEGGDYIVQFVYETLGDSFVQVQDDTVDYELNGLRRVTRESIAKAGTEFSKTVGTTEITHQINSEAALTLKLASYQVEDTDSYRKVVETYIEPGIVSVDRVEDSGRQTRVFRVFARDASSINEQFGYSGYRSVISSRTENYQGFEVNSYTYESNESEVDDYELNGLLRRTVTRLDTSLPTLNIGTGYFVGGRFLYLARQEIDNDGPTSRGTYVYVEQGKLSEERSSQSEGVYRVTTTFLAGNNFDYNYHTTGPIIAKTEDEIEGLRTITVVTLQDSNGNSIIQGDPEAFLVSHTLLSPFTYPGVVELETNLLGSGEDRDSFRATDYKLTPPCQALVPATLKISFRADDTIAYSSTSGLWNPKSWAKGRSFGIGWSYSPFSISRGFRGYRSIADSESGLGDTDPFSMISGKRIYGNTRYEISVEGGPEDPVGNEYTLNYDVSLAFEDIDGTKYYKHREVVATIPDPSA